MRTIDALKAWCDTGRMYFPTVEIYVRTNEPFNREVVDWGFQQLIQKHPWHDTQYRKATVRWTEEVVIKTDGSCQFSLKEELGSHVFRSSSNTLYLRQGQLLAFENWVQMLVRELANVALPNITIQDVYGRVTFSRTFPFEKPGRAVSAA